MFISHFKVKNSWIDHNNHMNVSYYHYVFQEALNQYWKHILEFEINNIKDVVISVKTAHIRYLSEAFLDDNIKVYSFLYKLDHAGFTVYQEIKRDDTAICVFNQYVNFYSTKSNCIVSCDNATFDRLSLLASKSDVTIPEWVERLINI